MSDNTSRYTREDVERMVEEEQVEFIRLQFTDLFGTLKNIAITKNNLAKAMDNRFLFDGTYIEGFSSGDESDMFLCPDPDTFEILSWRPQSGKVARLICDVMTTDGMPLSYDPRVILKRTLEEARREGILCNVGPECEFFLFQTDDEGRPTTESTEDAGYLDLGQSDLGENVRRDMVFALEDMNFDIEASYHEKGPGQHEIDFKYNNALRAADHIVTFKLAVKNIAKKHGLIATFMPKPMQNVMGSGMHINISLDRYGKNLFYDESGENKLSEDAYHFTAGVLRHLPGMTLLTNPIINSYKRLAGDDNVPNLLSYGTHGKRSAIRIPYIKGQENARIELKSPDASCNPYLAIAVVIAAGLEGIRTKADAGEFCARSKGTPRLLGRMGEPERAGVRADGTGRLPIHMGEAIEAFRKDAFVRSVIGEYAAELYLKSKTQEWEEYLKHVSTWEVDKYLLRG